MTKISEAQQLEVVSYIEETFNNYQKLNESRREELYEIYEEYRSFKQKKQADWSSSFKVNKAHEIVNKILPRLIAKNPRWVVTVRTDEFVDGDKLLTGEAKAERAIEQQKMADGIQDYLTYIFDRYNLREPIRLWAKNMLIYGKGYAKVKFKYETARIRESGGKIVEKVIGEYPTIDAKSWTDVYTDPRYVLLEDAPAIIEVVNGVRLADLKRKKDKYINIDVIEWLPNESDFTSDENGSKARIFELTGIPVTDISGGVDTDTLTLRTFYGKYALEGEEEWEDWEVESFEWEEKLYKVTTVNDMIVIEFEEITSIPFEDIKAFDDTETSNAVWVVEPIMSLQNEMNFKKNSASEYINQALNRSWIYSANSGINPADINSRPNGLMATTKDAQTAAANLVEIPHRALPSEYFGEQNDIERQIQAQTFTVDTSANKSNQALTNTATGARIKFFESNVVIDELRKHLEEGIERISYKLLEETFENMEDNIVIKKLDDSGFWEINKELLRDAFTRYSIKVEVNSSSFDDIESRQEESIGFFNMLLQAAQAGVPVDLTAGLEDIILNFEKKDPSRFIKAPEQVAKEQQVGGEQLQAPEAWPSNASELTESVAKWGLTTWA